MHRLFDAPLTSSWTNEQISAAIWALTKTRPDVKTCFLRSKTYRALCKKMRRASVRIRKAMTEAKYKELVGELAAADGDQEALLALRSHDDADVGNVVIL